jgi:hypothetical protein
MNRILLSLTVGALAGIIDIIPMFMQKLDRYSIASAFIQWVILGFVINHIEFGVGGWLKGLIVAVLLSIPVIALVVKADPKSAVPIVVMSAILGSVVGLISDKFIK